MSSSPQSSLRNDGIPHIHRTHGPHARPTRRSSVPRARQPSEHTQSAITPELCGNTGVQFRLCAHHHPRPGERPERVATISRSAFPPIWVFISRCSTARPLVRLAPCPASGRAASRLPLSLSLSFVPVMAPLYGRSLALKREDASSGGTSPP